MSESELTLEIKKQLKEQFEPVLGFQLYEEVQCSDLKRRIDVADCTRTYGFEIKVSKSDCYTGHGQNFDQVGFGYFVAPLSICGFISKLIKKNPDKYEYVGLLGYDEDEQNFIEIIPAKWNYRRFVIKNDEDLTGLGSNSTEFRTWIRCTMAETLINETIDKIEDFVDQMEDVFCRYEIFNKFVLDPNISDLDVRCERKSFNMKNFYQELKMACSNLEELMEEKYEE